MYQVHLKSSTFLFSNEKPTLENKRNYLQLNNPSIAVFEKYMKNLPVKHKTVFVKSENPDQSLMDFESLFTVIEAAGGLVTNKKGEILFIFRSGKWDLPKGKMDYKEKQENAAVREVQEECGISGLKTGKLLCTTLHGYEIQGKNFLKKTYWFEMKYAGDEILTPQTEEGITEATWVGKKEIEKFAKNTYPSILEVLRAGKLI